MFNYKGIEDIINKFCEEEDVNIKDLFFDGAKLSEINAVEEQLKVKLPNSYKWFLEKYGSGGVDGTLFWGIESKKNVEENTVVYATQKYREKGLDSKLVVFEENGEYITCLDTAKMGEDNECPVVTWSNYDLDGIIIEKENFFEYFLQCLDDYL